MRETKRAYGWPEDAQFLVPDGVYEHFAAGIGERGARLHDEWKQRVDRRGRRPSRSRSTRCSGASCPTAGTPRSLSSTPDEKGVATRKAAHQVLNSIAAQGAVAAQRLRRPHRLGGERPRLRRRRRNSSPSDRAGRNLHYGIREHESAAISNGLSLSKLRPVWSTYLIFSDYARPAIRLSALMELPVIHWFSHDSIGLGEDGPTHQPVEQLASLRAIPNLNVIRPCDANEVAAAWRVIMPLRHEPAALVLSRQDLPVLDRSKLRLGGWRSHGAATCSADCEGEPEVILIATGSEVHLAVSAYEELSEAGVRARVVSLPSWQLFDRQDDAYRESVLPASVGARVAVEQASTLGWDRYVGPQGKIVGMHTFGASAPLRDVENKFGFTPEKVAEAAQGAARAGPVGMRGTMK